MKIDNKILIILILLIISCKKEIKKVEILEDKTPIFLSFTYGMSEEEFNKALEFHNKNKSLIGNIFELELLNSMLFFEISRNRETIQLESNSITDILQPNQYTDELIKVYDEKYDIVEPLNLPIHSRYDKNTNQYLYNLEGAHETFKDRKTNDFKYYGFEQTIYYKAENLNSNIVVLIGYSFSKSKQGIGNVLDPEQFKFDENWKDITITINYFSREGFNSLIKKIESTYNEFQKFKESETNKEEEMRKFRDSITKSNVEKI